MINIGLLNFEMGNLKSVLQVLKKVNCNFNIFIIDKNFKNFSHIDKIIIPGQGCNYDWLKQFLNFNFLKIFEIFINKPTLGICIGKHIFFKTSEEFKNINLNLFNGLIKIFENINSFNVPNIGWNNVYFLKNHKLLTGLKNGCEFYFSHSYFLICNNNSNLYGFTKHFNYFPSIFIKNNLCLVQFHPEKSHFQGLKFFENFFNWNL